MATILDLFKNKNSYKYGTIYKNVKPDKDTRFEFETKGIRIRSAVELNNPRIYGNEALRISTRSTPIVEEQKTATGGEGGDGGLIGKGLSALTGGKVSSLSDVRNRVNSFLGIPEILYPTRIVTKREFTAGEEQDTHTTLAIIKKNAAGSEFGKFLKNSGGGTPKTIGQQIKGNAIGSLKGEIRGALFGEPISIRQLVGEKSPDSYSLNNTYSRILREAQQNDISSGEFTRIDLSLVSPIKGLDRTDTDGRFGNTKYAFQGNKIQYGNSPKNPYTGIVGEVGSATLEDRGIGGIGIRINGLGPSDVYSKEEASKLDLIPFWISSLDSSKPIFFQTLVTGISETVTPSWSGEKFVGNPYSFYKYEGVERSVSFGLQLYCMNPLELAKTWEKIEYLSSKAYPTIIKKLISPPIIKFRLGDIYREKIGFIESLSYTIPDQATWEIDVEGLKLPKFIDVSITIKFIENIGAEASLYSYGKSPDVVKEINAYLSEASQNFGGESKTGEGNTPPSTVDEYGTPQDTAPSSTGISKDGKTGIDSTPKDNDTGNPADVPKRQYDKLEYKRGSNAWSQSIINRERELLNENYETWAAKGLSMESINGLSDIKQLDVNTYYYTTLVTIGERVNKTEKVIIQKGKGYQIMFYNTWLNKRK